MKLLWEMLFLFSVILTLSISSEIYGLGIPAICFLIFAFQKRRLGKIFAYRKSVAYLAIVPFAFWWFLSPSQNGVFSQWLLIIPSWYFLFLALWQWKSVGRGGYSVFVMASLSLLAFCSRSSALRAFEEKRSSSEKTQPQ